MNVSRRAAMTLIELLIAMSITSALLVALAAAFHGSFHAVERNDAYFRSTQTARILLDQLTGEVRRADAVEVGDKGNILRIIRPVGLLTANEVYRQYTYDSARRCVKMQIFSPGDVPGPQVEVATDISVCTFGPAEMGQDDHGLSVAVLVPIHIQCSINGASVSLDDAAGPRRVARRK